MTPSPEEVRSELETVLASRSFAASARLSRFLRFVVERTLAGDGERLKEYVLGVEVFDRGADYDPRVDSIVRVEAGRVRSKLDEHYGGEGAGAALRIKMQKGSYAPLFELRADTAVGDGGIATSNGEAPNAHAALTAGNGAAARADAVATGEPAVRGPRRIIVARWSVALVLALAAIAAIAWRQATAPQVPRTAIAVLPFISSLTSEADAALATRLTERVTAELVRRGEIMVIASASARAAAEGHRPAREISRELDAQFLLQARTRHDGGQLFVEALLVNGASEQKFWVDSFSAGEQETEDLARRVAAGAAAAIGSAPAGRGTFTRP